MDAFAPLPPDLCRYLRQPGFPPLLEAARRRFESLGRIGGSLRLDKLTGEQLDCLNGFFGRQIASPHCPAGAVSSQVAPEVLTFTVSVRMTEIDQALRQSRWQITLEEVLYSLYGQQLELRPQRRQKNRQAWQTLIERVKAQASPAAQAWIDAVADRRSGGYRILKSAFDGNPADTEAQLLAVTRAIARLDRRSPSAHTLPAERLPIFAAQITGDPHAFDRATPLGRLFSSALAYLFRPGESLDDVDSSGDASESAEAHRALLRAAGLDGDDISSFVTVFGLPAMGGTPLHPLMEAATGAGEPLNLTLRNLRHIPTTLTSGQHWDVPEGQPVYLVENPAVFSGLLDRWLHLPPASRRHKGPLICTSGQLSLAALLLLDSLIHAGCRLFYSGDFDGKGLEIALQLERRYNASGYSGASLFQPWRFDCQTYQKAVKQVALSEDQRRRVAEMTVPWDAQLPAIMVETGLIAYQENLIVDLIIDWLNAT
ncbi:TIGR02679 family protein [Heliobacterium gestii]|uniref:TIGR02679 family protein n=1 Tax=Heliomicrobium gestii TaxID=2699 RepID=A0A845LAI6_HELGE|nr:TIGR02679 family protein [Heliomicrobium gestii]MBM7866886.1 uncharacterized protein (TIGR02679 family) [Heliomicrobium gestii]MZP42314.1 TIGR02679 family protein [Heliomicrobium gestii]